MRPGLSVAEEWRSIPGLEGYYEASDQGRIRSVSRTYINQVGKRCAVRGQVLKPNKVDGRFWVTLAGPVAKKDRRAVHRLVLMAFAGLCPDGMEGCHNNGVATDNRIENLRWDTRSANQLDSVQHGTHAAASRTHCPKGHAYDDANTRIRPCGRRSCRACHRETVAASRRRAARRLLVGVTAGAVLAGTGVGFAGHAEAEPAGVACQTDLWGFLGSARRTLCDGPVRADGSWERLRVVWTPAHTTPVVCTGALWLYCYGGDFVGERVSSRERYPVMVSTVLPDEPQHLVGAA